MALSVPSAPESEALGEAFEALGILILADIVYVFEEKRRPYGSRRSEVRASEDGDGKGPDK